MTAINDADIAAGEARLIACVNRIVGWRAMFVPEYAEKEGAVTIIEKMDSIGSADNTDAADLRKAACGKALYDAITTAGYGDQVTPEQCVEAAGEVIEAVEADRAKRSK